jgi:DnaJ-domain-containing protein 1
MLPYILAGAAILVALMLALRGFLAADPRALARGLRWIAIGLGLAVVMFLAFNGRLGMALGLAAFVLPIALRWRDILVRMKAARGPTPGQRSRVQTRFLAMELDHDSGAMDGTVIVGRFAGRRLADLGLDQLVDLLDQCRADPQSVAVLEAWLDRERPDWREDRAEGQADPRDAGARRAGPPGGMSRDEALEVLGLEPGASPERIRDAHRRLMIRNHPDRGGSTYLAARINQAKDVLLAD